MSKTVTAKDPAAKLDKSLAGAYTVTASGLNVRDGAGTAKKILVTIPRGTKVQNYGYYTEVSGTKWLYVQFTYRSVTYTGFASGTYLEKQKTSSTTKSVVITGSTKTGESKRPYLVHGVVDYPVYAQKKYSSSVLQANGCGYCALATALNYAKINYTPDKLMSKIHSWFGSGKALTCYGIQQTAKKLGVSATIVATKDKAACKKTFEAALKKGKPVLFCNDTPHWLCLLGYNSGGKLVYVSSTGTSVRTGTLGALLDTRRKASGSNKSIYWKGSNSGQSVIIG